MIAKANPVDIGAILAENADARAELMAAIEGVPSDRRVMAGVLDGWSLKDVMVHIAAWQEAPATVFGILGAGEELDPDFDPDEFNAQAVAEHADDRWDDVMAWLGRARDGYEQSAREAMQRLSTEETAAGGIVDGVLRSNGAAHDREHTVQILEWRKEQGL